MLSSSVLGGNSNSPSTSRVFVYEVTGLKQSQTNDSNDYQFRSSGSVFVSVPYSRMNEEMQRIGKMGGTIVNIQPQNGFQASEEAIDEQADDSKPAKKSQKSKK
ncbi:MAG: phycobilisome linker polypeptide [Pleurocapsa sp.]